MKKGDVLYTIDWNAERTRRIVVPITITHIFKSVIRCSDRLPYEKTPTNGVHLAPFDNYNRPTYKAWLYQTEAETERQSIRILGWRDKLSADIRQLTDLEAIKQVALCFGTIL